MTFFSIASDSVLPVTVSEKELVQAAALCQFHGNITAQLKNAI